MIVLQAIEFMRWGQDKGFQDSRLNLSGLECSAVVILQVMIAKKGIYLPMHMPNSSFLPFRGHRKASHDFPVIFVLPLGHIPFSSLSSLVSLAYSSIILKNARSISASLNAVCCHLLPASAMFLAIA